MSRPQADTIANTPVAAQAPAARPLGTVLVTLVRRELWEHRYLWIAPLVLAVLLAVLAVVANVNLDLDDESQITGADQRVAIFTLIAWGLSVPFYVLTLFIASFYLLDCLYAERKDRSILFWKSLPVSDGATVAAKLLTGLVVVPLAVFALGIVANLAVLAILGLRISAHTLPPLMSWDTLEWLKSEFMLLLVQLLAILWYAPWAGYLVLVSAWARRVPFLWATVPLLAIGIFEKMAFNTAYFAGVLGYRFGGGGEDSTSKATDISLAMLNHLSPGQFLASPGLWVGLLFTAACLAVAVRLRRYREPI